ncbi:hypothetical protein ABIE48_003208 [Paenibacillus sp. OAE614]
MHGTPRCGYRNSSTIGKLKKRQPLCWLSFFRFPDDAQVGQKVKILFKGEMATSYSGLSGAKKVSILPSIKPDKAK